MQLILAFATMVLSLASWAETGSDQDYPNRPISVIVPYAAGGTTDILTRIVTNRLERQLGQPIVVQNRPGAAGTIGVRAGAKSAPDGYTLIMGDLATLAVAGILHNRYDPIKDFEAIGLVGRVPLVMTATPSLPSTTVSELVQLAKSEPGKLNYGSLGVGSPQQLAMEFFKQRANVNIAHIPYNAMPRAVTALMTGEVSVLMLGLPNIVSHVETGKLKPLAAATRSRLRVIPNVPTFAEAGYPDFESYVWFGFIAPKGTPAAISAKLNEEVTRAVQSPEVVEQFAKLSLEPITSTSEEFTGYISSEVQRWITVIRRAGITLN